MLVDVKSIANSFNNYFTDVTHSLGLKKKNIRLEDTLSKIVKNFKNFDSINKIKELPQFYSRLRSTPKSWQIF